MITLPTKFTVVEDGDANWYQLREQDPERWIVAIQLTGELPLDRQRAIVRMLAVAPEMRLILAKWAGYYDGSGRYSEGTLREELAQVRALLAQL
jgi:hypothetical protein